VEIGSRIQTDMDKLFEVETQIDNENSNRFSTETQSDQMVLHLLYDNREIKIRVYLHSKP